MIGEKFDLDKALLFFGPWYKTWRDQFLPQWFDEGNVKQAPKKAEAARETDHHIW